MPYLVEALGQDGSTTWRVECQSAEYANEHVGHLLRDGERVRITDPTGKVIGISELLDAWLAEKGEGL